MRKVVLMVFLILSIKANAQVGIGTTTPDVSSILDIQSNIGGILIPRMSEAQKLAIVSPATGLLVYETDIAPGFWYYNGTVWTTFGGVDLDWTISGTDMYNANSGNVGVGTAIPTNKLHVEGTAVSNATLIDGFEDNSLAPFTTFGDVTWRTTALAALVNTGTFSARTRSSLIDDETSSLQYNAVVTSSQTLSFAVTTSTEAIYDELTFYIDGVAKGSWSGDTAYTTVSYLLTPGAHTLIWTYEKDFSAQDGLDSVAIDDISITGMDIGVIRIVDGNQGDGKILVSDDYGNATWTDPTLAPDGDWTISGSDMYNTNSGNIGIGVTIPTRKLQIKDDRLNNSVLHVENTNSQNGKSYGIHGITNGTKKGSAGIYGLSRAYSDHEMGVKGAYRLWGAAVAGIGYNIIDDDMASLQDYGVWGAIDYSDGVGIYALNKDLTAGTAYGAYVDGNFAVVNGTKSGSVPTSKGNQLVYSMESPEIWFEDFGTGKLINGQVHINLDELFHETIIINDKHPMHVFIQEQGNSNGVFFLPDTDGKGFTVKEKNGGNSNFSFSYRITAKRRFFQEYRFGVDGQQPLENNLIKVKDMTPPSRDPNVVKAKREQWRATKRAKYKGTQVKANFGK
ncbi:MAG: hypothetical protein COA88_05520 [Kordia sp.]|nr:MAG: hypothetical protein COA88_05520 [Kordia sp.]